MEKGHLAELQAMYRDWPFFQSTIDLIEMVMAKADMTIAQHYDDVLVSGELKALGAKLRQEFDATVAAVLEVTPAASARLTVSPALSDC
jgi:phosphoenolpyruvate carboxylase